MKYIRLKNGRIVRLQSGSKIADNIRELCQKFELEYYPDYIDIFHNFEEAIKKYNENHFNGEYRKTIYGCCLNWDTQEFIRVAKMNEEGEFELL